MESSARAKGPDHVVLDVAETIVPSTQARQPRSKADYGSCPRQSRDTKKGSPEFRPPANRAFEFGMLVLANYFAEVGNSIIAPIFPAVVQNKHLSLRVMGLIFGCFPFAALCASLFSGRSLTTVGPRFLATAGNIVGGVCNIGIGLCLGVHSPVILALFCMAFRLFAGAAMGCLATATLATLPSLFGDSVSTANGMLDAARLAGMASGPCLGTWLLGLGVKASSFGDALPFAALGMAELLVGLASSCFLSVESNAAKAKAQNPPSLFGVSSAAIPALITSAWTSSLMGIVALTLQTFLSASPIVASPGQVASTFTYICFLQGLAAPIAGFLDDKTEGRWAREIMALGTISSALAFVLVADSESYEEVMCRVSLPIVILPFMMVPMFKQVLRHARGGSDPEKNAAAASALNVVFLSGLVAGPILGGAVQELVGLRPLYRYIAVAGTCVGCGTYVMQLCCQTSSSHDPPATSAQN